MKYLKILYFFYFSLCLTSHASVQVSKYSWYDSSSNKYMSLSEGISSLPDKGIFILGESHYQKSIMDAQGDFIEKLVTAKKRQGDFCVGWEFLNFTDQKQIESKFTLYKTGQLGLEELFKEFFPSRSIEHEVYAPLFQMAKKYQGTVLGTNAPRLWKRVIINEGFSTLSQDRIPRLMQRGSDNYYERFLEAMGGHADLSVIEKYFMAQSYTDATMAQSLIDLSNAQVKIMITGHFHSDFGHGLPSYLEKGTNKNIELIRFVDFKNIPEEERDSILKEHPKYGQRAAYFLIINKNAQ